MVRAMTDNSDPKTPANPFGDVQDKSLEAQAQEVKSAAAPSTADEAEDAGDGEGVAVKMLHHVTLDGEDLIPGVEYDVTADDAARLVASRRADYVE